MDELHLQVIPVDDARLNVVKIVINGNDLIDLVRDYEKPFAEMENKPDLAGAYTNIALRVLSPPSKHLFGEPEDSEYIYKDKVEILSCECCGGSWCWPLSVCIKINENTVIWEDFVQPHRIDPKSQNVWDYNGFGPFEFERILYEKEVAKLNE